MSDGIFFFEKIFIIEEISQINRKMGVMLEKIISKYHLYYILFLAVVYLECYIVENN